VLVSKLCFFKESKEALIDVVGKLGTENWGINSGVADMAFAVDRSRRPGEELDISMIPRYKPHFSSPPLASLFRRLVLLWINNLVRGRKMSS